MSQTRRAAHHSLKNTELPLEHVTAETLQDYVVEGFPLHPAFHLLSAIHKGDYLRSYFMHHYGGAYSDIKPTSQSWLTAFDQLEANEWVWVNGYPEVARGRVAAKRTTPKGVILKLAWRLLLGNGAYIMRPSTPFTAEWRRTTERRLDRLLPLLEESPARDPRERGGRVYAGTVSRYPVPWAALHGEIFHPLCLRYVRHLRRDLPPPRFKDYK